MEHLVEEKNSSITKGGKARQKMPHEEYRRRQNEYQAKYDEANTTRIGLKLNNITDRDIIAMLSCMDSKQGFIRRVLQEEADRRKADGRLTVPISA